MNEIAEFYNIRVYEYPDGWVEKNFFHKDSRILFVKEGTQESKIVELFLQLGKMENITPPYFFNYVQIYGKGTRIIVGG
ncbi:TPA: hypothetical protein TY768_000892 [Streptococcus suis]|nr:hypothetical protein [Streptococcus suis]